MTRKGAAPERAFLSGAALSLSKKVAQCGLFCYTKDR